MCVLFFFNCLLAFPAVTVLFVLLLITMTVRGNWNQHRLQFWTLAVTYIAVIHAAISVHALYHLWVLRSRYPVESMESRLPPAGELTRSQPLKPDPKLRFQKYEHEIMIGFSEYNWRTNSLRDIHHKAVTVFVNSPGFGVERSLVMRSPYSHLPDSDRDGKLVPIPNTRTGSSGTTGDEIGGTARSEVGTEGHIHMEGTLAFLRPRKMGYVRDRNHVIGFEPHGIGDDNAYDRDPNWWKSVLKLDLVSLILHDKPVAYVSDHFPRMSERRDVLTRDLDPFETAALEQLRTGEDLIVTDRETVTRLFGAVRAAKECVTCHGGNRGDLLGAFSYWIRRSE